jgi:phosphatidylglycerophosphate synthase
VISAKLGHLFDKPLAPLAKRISISPNALSVAGFFLTAAAAGVIPLHLGAGGVLILVGGFFDMLDGVVARTNGKRSTFGAFLDSTLDRYSDSLLFLAAAWYFFDRNYLPGVLITIGSLVGALLISYVRARAEGLGIPCHVGLMERPERVVLLSAGCLTGWLFQTMIILFVLSHITVIQRIAHVYGSARHR